MELPLNPSSSPMALLAGTFQVMSYKPPWGSTLQVRDTTPEEALSSVIVTSDGTAEVGEGRRGGGGGEERRRGGGGAMDYTHVHSYIH